MGKYIVIGKFTCGPGEKVVKVLTKDFVELTVDHIIPLSKGGKNEKKNKQCLCYTCNQIKGNKIIEQPKVDNLLQYL